MFSLRLRSKEVEVKADTVFFPNRSQIRIGEKRTCVSSNKPHVETRPFSSVHQGGSNARPQKKRPRWLAGSLSWQIHTDTEPCARPFAQPPNTAIPRERKRTTFLFGITRFIHQRKKDQLIGKARNEKSGDDPFSFISTSRHGTQNPDSSGQAILLACATYYELVRYISSQILNSLRQLPSPAERPARHWARQKRRVLSCLCSRSRILPSPKLAHAGDPFR